MTYYRALQLISLALTVGAQGVKIAQRITEAALEQDVTRLDAAAELADEADEALAQAIREARDAAPKM